VRVGDVVCERWALDAYLLHRRQGPAGKTDAGIANLDHMIGLNVFPTRGARFHQS